MKKEHQKTETTSLIVGFCIVLFCVTAAVSGLLGPVTIQMAK